MTVAPGRAPGSGSGPQSSAASASSAGSSASAAGSGSAAGERRPRVAGALDVAELMRRELGAERVLVPGDDRLDAYGRDHSPLGDYPADCAVLAESAAEVAQVLALARAHRVPVTPRGAGSGMTGGALPVRGGIVLSTERMSRILEIDAGDLVAVVQPGAITGTLQEAVEAEGMFYPPDPASLAFCSIGGNVASNAGGPRAFKYGVTRNYVLGLEVGLVGGELLRCGRRTSKGVTGYDLAQGFVGTEGTFGVITELTLKLLPRPPAAGALLAVFRDVAACGAAVGAIIAAGVWPRALEIADRSSVEHVRPHARYKFPADAGAICLLELDGEPEGVEASLLRAGEVCEGAGAIDVLVAQDPAQRRALWEARRIISQSLRGAHRWKVNEDVCVPRGSIVPMLAHVDRLSAETGLAFATFGHAGDGNLHVNILVDDDPEDPAVRERVEAARGALFARVVELRGTLSGEHGIGLTKQRFIPLEQSERLIAWQRRWKQMWDPDELLNPGKIFPESALRVSACTE